MNWVTADNQSANSHNSQANSQTSGLRLLVCTAVRARLYVQQPSKLIAQAGVGAPQKQLTDCFLFVSQQPRFSLLVRLLLQSHQSTSCGSGWMPVHVPVHVIHPVVLLCPERVGCAVSGRPCIIRPSLCPSLCPSIPLAVHRLSPLTCLCLCVRWNWSTSSF